LVISRSRVTFSVSTATTLSAVVAVVERGVAVVGLVDLCINDGGSALCDQGTSTRAHRPGRTPT
jgi:hypothetical protein